MPTNSEFADAAASRAVTSHRTPKSRAIFQLFVVLLLIVSFGFIEVDAQSRRKRRTRRSRPVVKRPVITNPTITPATETADSTAGDPKIISTADQTPDGEQSSDQPQPKKSKTSKPASSDPEDMQQTINSLTNQVNRLNDRLTSMQEDDRFLLEMERLTRAEQRAEQLRSQLIDVQSKMADLNSRLEQVDYMLKPENVERATQGYGTVHPEEARDTRRRQLESEKGRLQAQLNILETSRVRLEAAIATADSEVDLLRARLNEKRMEGNNPKTEPAKPITRKPE
jgi:chromosome segregation ATPase